MKRIIIVFALIGCHDASTSTVTLATPQTSATPQASSSIGLSMPESPEVTTTKRAATLAAKVRSWREKHPDDCPLAQSLVREGVIAAELAIDGWSRPFKIVCDEDDTHVSSFGADGKEGTADDIGAP